MKDQGIRVSEVVSAATVHQCQSGTNEIVIYVTAKPPAQGAVAVVLDFSDSCELKRSELIACSQLLMRLPRSWPIWLYGLSGCQPIVPTNRYCVADLQDKRLNLSDLLESSSISQSVRGCGSLIQPVIASIEATRVAAGLGSITVLVIGDGELLDIAPCDLPDELKVVGISSSKDPSRRLHWRRVLPESPLCDWSDRRLDSEFTSTASPYYGLCKVGWQSPLDLESQVMRFDVRTALFLPVSGHDVECNLAADPLILCLALNQLEFSSLRWSCKSLQTNAETHLQISLDQSNFPPGVLQELQEAKARIAKPASTILLDASMHTEDFTILWDDAGKMAELADRRARWIDEQRRLLFFRDRGLHDEHQSSKHDALLCLVRGDLTVAPDSNARIVVIALDQNNHPALRWTSDDPVDSLVPARSLEIDFKRDRSRWCISYDGQSPEILEPFGSQCLSGELLRDEGWKVLFSGRLT